jgi:hypothetical protein
MEFAVTFETLENATALVIVVNLKTLYELDIVYAMKVVDEHECKDVEDCGRGLR